MVECKKSLRVVGYAGIWMYAATTQDAGPGTLD